MFRSSLHTFALAGLLLIATAAPASAASSAITTPADPTFHLWAAGQSEAERTLTVRGTATDLTEVDVRCYRSRLDDTVWSVPVATGVPVGAGGTFSVEADWADVAARSCRLRAVPAGTAADDAGVAAFTGPRLAVSVDEATDPTWEAYYVQDGPNAGARHDFYVWGAQLEGSADYRSAGYAGVWDHWLLDPVSLAETDPVFYGNAGLTGPEPTDGTPERASIRIDGRDAFAPAGAVDLFERSGPAAFDGSIDNAGLPEVEYEVEHDAATGDLVIREREALVRCDAATDKPVLDVTRADCPAFVPTGVRLERTITQDRGGRVVTIRDAFVSTDGKAHALDLLYDEWLNDRAWRYRFPWATGEAYVGREQGDTVAAAPAGPATIFMRQEGSAETSTMHDPQGALTTYPAPDGIRFERYSRFALRFTRTVPAAGTLPITHTLNVGLDGAELRALAAEAADSHAVRVAIDAPAAGATVREATVTVRGTAAAESVTVNGREAKIGAGGGWQVDVPLRDGANELVATAKDAHGAAATARRTVTYAPGSAGGGDGGGGTSGDAGGPAADPQPHGDGPVARIAGARGVRGGARAITATLTCAGGGPACAGQLRAVARVPKRSARARGAAARTRRVVLGRKRFSIPAGQSRKVRVKLSRKGRRTLARRRRVRTELVARLAGAPATRLARVTLRAPR